MKKSLFALALFAVVGTAAHAQEGQAKADKKGKKEACAMKGSMAGGSCCMKGSKTATTRVKPAAKPVVAVKL